MGSLELFVADQKEEPLGGSEAAHDPRVTEGARRGDGITLATLEGQGR